MPALHATFASSSEFLSCFDGEIARAGLLVRGATLENVGPSTMCQLFVQVGGEPKLEIAGR